MGMALGRRERERQEEFWVSTPDLPRSAGHVFYRRLNELLAEARFDEYVEERCRPLYADKGRRSIPPGVYFRMLLVGYFEGIGSQRGIAWRCSDSLSLREFLGLAITDDSPDHSSLTRIRDRLPLETHERVFEFVLKLAADRGLLKGKTVGVDSTTLEANAAMKSIVRRDTGEDWADYIRGLMREQGIEDPTEEEMRRFDKARLDKRVSNEDWRSATDPEAEITRMKDGTTHLAYKAEHVVDLDTELVLEARILPGTAGDAATIVDSVMSAQTHVDNTGAEAKIEEIAADKGYHSTATLELADSLNKRTYFPERQGKRNRKRLSKRELAALLKNRQRMGREKGKELQRRRSERCERSFAHICETGGARRTWLRGLEKVQKRYWLAAVARNLGLVMRKAFGMGTPRGLAAAQAVLLLTQIPLFAIWRRLCDPWRPWPLFGVQARRHRGCAAASPNVCFSTGC
jgi:transposase